MKKVFLSLFVALMATVAAQAQQIAVVAEDGTTNMYRTLSDAIEHASTGSVIYLPGGGFVISDEMKITKKLHIIGIGYNLDGRNADGITTIGGNLWFSKGSDGSSVIGCYISGNVNIGNDAEIVNDVLINRCNLKSVQVNNSECIGTEVNQNYVRETCNFGKSEVTISNNVIGKIQNIATGVISYNTCCHKCYGSTIPFKLDPALENVNNSTIIGNIFRGENPYYDYFHTGTSCVLSKNLFVGGSTVGNNPIVIDAGVNDIFVNVNNWSITPASNFHFKEGYKEYESQCGIYAGTGFDQRGFPPVPYIVNKEIDPQTDASGMLKVTISVKAGE